MATITSVADGNWDDAATWDSSTIPTASDDVVIASVVTIRYDVYANSVYITTTGSLIAEAQLRDDPDSAYPVMDLIHVNIRRWRMDGKFPDDRTVSLRGIRLMAASNDPKTAFTGLIPSISCIRTDSTFPPTSVIEFDGQLHTMEDPAPIGMNVTLERTANEGATKNGANWNYAGVRSQAVTVHWDKQSPFDVGEMLSRMAAQPADVLVVSHTDVIKGHIESIQPAQSGGEGRLRVALTIVEGVMED